MFDYENTDSGYVSLFRSVQEKSWYTDSHFFHLWSHLLMSANYKDNFVNGMEIKRGQLLTGRKKLAEKTGINESKIERILTFFEESEQQIEQQKTNKFRVITIKNYDQYQSVNNKVNNTEQQKNSRRTAENTNNKDNNTNKDNTHEKLTPKTKSPIDNDNWVHYGQPVLKQLLEVYPGDKVDDEALSSKIARDLRLDAIGYDELLYKTHIYLKNIEEPRFVKKLSDFLFNYSALRDSIHDKERCRFCNSDDAGGYVRISFNGQGYKRFPCRHWKDRASFEAYVKLIGGKINNAAHH